MNSPHLQRGILLLQQSRYQPALEEFEQVLIESPELAGAHSFRGLCLARLERFADAVKAANTAIHLAPDFSHAYYVASIVNQLRNSLNEAEKFIRTAIELEPFDDIYFGQLASILMDKEKWRESLDAANAGLELDAENAECTNIRAIALVKLGKKAEAGDSIKAALERNPEDAWSHANMGWTHLERGKPKDALPSFREALRLEPDMEWARLGIIEAMKSHFIVYRWLLAFFLWTSKLTGRTQFLLMAGGYFGSRALSQTMDRHPELSVFLMPILIAYVAFAIMTWIGSPLFNMTLWFHPFGRMALSDPEKRTSLAIALLVFTSLFFTATWFASTKNVYLHTALSVALVMPLVATVQQSNKGWPRAVHWLYLSVLLSLVIATVPASIGLLFAVPNSGPKSNAYVAVYILIIPLVFLGFVSQIISQFLIAFSPPRDSRAGRWVWWVGGPIAALFVLSIYSISILTLFGFPRDSYSLSDRSMLGFDGIDLRITVKKIERLAKSTADKLDKLSSELKKIGFDDAGDYVINGIKRDHIRYLLNADLKSTAEIFLSSSGSGVSRTLSAMDETGNVFEVSDSGYFSGFTMPSGWVIESVPVAAKASEMLQKLNQITAGKELRTFTSESIPEMAQEVYARKIDFHCSTGGLTLDKIHSTTKELDKLKSKSDLALICTFSNLQLAGKVDRLLLEHVVEERPELVSVQSELITVHRLKAANATLFRAASTDQINAKGRLRRLSAVDISLESTRTSNNEPDFVDRVKGMVDTDRFEHVVRLSSPLTADIYRRKVGISGTDSAP